MKIIDFINLGCLNIADATALIGWVAPNKKLADVLTRSQQARIKAALRWHYQLKMPISYIVNKHQFYGRDYYVQYCLIPRYTTEIIVEDVFKIYKIHPKTILDLGCGSGVIAITCALKWTNSLVRGVDICSKSLVTAKQNRALLKADNVDLSYSDWFTKLKNNYYELVICNPPYVDHKTFHRLAKSLRHEPYHAISSAHNGLKDLLLISQEAHMYAETIVLEHLHHQSQVVQANLLNHGYKFFHRVKDESATIGTIATKRKGLLP